MTHSHNIVDYGSHFVIDPLLRTITSVAEEVVLVEGDHNSERYTFEIPRMVEGHDMSLTDRIEIHYDNIAKNKKDISEGMCIATGVTVDDNTLRFDWLVTENVTKFAGTTKFWINFICLDNDDNIIYSWGTEIFKSILVLPNNDNTDSVIAKFPDVLSQWKEAILSDLNVIGESQIAFIESPTEDGRMLCLRDLDSGIYILNGRFKPFSLSTISYTFSNNVLASINRDDDVSYVQVLYPKNNTVQYMEITDDDVSRNDARLVDMQSSENLTTVIDENSDDQHYPSAKAVYEALSEIVPGCSDVSEEKIAQAVADYFDKNQITGNSPASIGVVELFADKWVGANNLHSQVVSIEGVTEYSQVDLTPSVEQLVVFYEKDLTFVTENEGGVVTVYAIGQKPTNDYVVQVTITEVNI